jgi:hypothetical protein
LRHFVLAEFFVAVAIQFLKALFPLVFGKPGDEGRLLEFLKTDRTIAIRIEALP